MFVNKGSTRENFPVLALLWLTLVLGSVLYLLTNRVWTDQGNWQIPRLAILGVLASIPVWVVLLLTLFDLSRSLRVSILITFVVLPGMVFPWVGPALATYFDATRIVQISFYFFPAVLLAAIPLAGVRLLVGRVITCRSPDELFKPSLGLQHLFGLMLAVAGYLFLAGVEIPFIERPPETMFNLTLTGFGLGLITLLGLPLLNAVFAQPIDRRKVMTLATFYYLVPLSLFNMVTFLGTQAYVDVATNVAWSLMIVCWIGSITFFGSLFAKRGFRMVTLPRVTPRPETAVVERQTPDPFELDESQKP